MIVPVPAALTTTPNAPIVVKLRQIAIAIAIILFIFFITPRLSRSRPRSNKKYMNKELINKLPATGSIPMAFCRKTRPAGLKLQTRNTRPVNYFRVFVTLSRKREKRYRIFFHFQLVYSSHSVSKSISCY